jgi:hypothetical protein
MPTTKQPKIIDYNGPSGAYVVTGGSTMPLSDPNAMVALVDSTLLTGLGYSEKASEYQKLASSRARSPSSSPTRAKRHQPALLP